MGKLEGLRVRIGDELTNKLALLLDEKEAEALELGMTPKEKKEDESVADEKTDEAADKSEEAVTEDKGVDVTALAGEFAKALLPFGEQMKEVSAKIAAVETTVKEIATLKEAITKLQTDLNTAAVAAKEAKDGVTELRGDMPKGQKRGHRASEDDTNVTESKKEGPGPDPLSSFISDFALAHPNQSA